MINYEGGNKLHILLASIGELVIIIIFLYTLKTRGGIYKRKQESKKTRKQELDQEKKFFFLITILVEFLFSCFLTFVFSFINSHLKTTIGLLKLTIKKQAYSDCFCCGGGKAEYYKTVEFV